MRKRTIDARVERLWHLAPYTKRYIKQGYRYYFDNLHGLYTLNRGKAYLNNLAEGVRREIPAYVESQRMLDASGWAWSDAHEFAHGWDFDNRYYQHSKGETFRRACADDSLKPIRARYSDPMREDFGFKEMFADTIAYTIVNDRTFIRKHPAKYAYARALLKEAEVI